KGNKKAGRETRPPGDAGGGAGDRADRPVHQAAHGPADGRGLQTLLAAPRATSGCPSRGRPGSGRNATWKIGGVRDRLDYGAIEPYLILKASSRVFQVHTTLT